MTEELRERLEEIKAADKEATPGEWVPGHLSDDKHKCNCTSILSKYHFGSVAQISLDNGLKISEGGNDAPPLSEAKGNQKLICLLRNAFPLLVSELERLEAKNERLKKERDQVRRLMEAVRDWAAKLEAAKSMGEDDTADLFATEEELSRAYAALQETE